MSSSRHVSDGLRQPTPNAPARSNFLQTCNLLTRYMKERGSLRDLNLEIEGKVESLDAIVKPESSLSASPSTTINSNSLGIPSKSAKQTSSEVSRPDSSSIITIEDASSKASTSKEGTTTELKHPQLTIFYSGRVLVFDDYPADKARELVSIARKSSSQMSYAILPNTTQEKPNSKQPVGISSNSFKEKSSPSTSGAVSREGLPPRPQPAGGKQPIGILSDGCREKTNVASSSKAVEKQTSPAQSDANGSDLPIARRSSLHRFLEKRKDRAAARGPYQNPEQLVAGGSSPPSPCSSKGDEQLDLNL